MLPEPVHAENPFQFSYMSTDSGEIVNKIQQSEKLVTIDLQEYYDSTPRVELDLKDFLFKGLLLKEKEFREQLKSHNWDQYKDQYVCVFCSTDAIIAKWAYMLIAQHLTPFAKEVFEGRASDLLSYLYRRKLDSLNWSNFKNKFVILKGCNDKEKPVPESVYLHATQKLVPHVKKLMYGEACSNVPVYRG